MIAEIICIGTELLLGDVVNTNASFLGQELASIGIDLYYVTTVGDNKKRIIDSLKTAFDRADVIITSGGLGPTKDDLTHECIADFLGVKMEFYPDMAERLKTIFKSLNREVGESNLKQAYFPKGSEILPNATGTAPGIIYTRDNRILMTFPGVPSELKNMWKTTSKSYLHRLNPDKSVIKSKVLRFTGQGESYIADKVSELLDLGNPTVAPLAGKGEMRLRITAKAESEEKAAEIIKPVEQEILSRVGKYCYGSDDDSLTSVVAEMLKERQQTLAIAESFTGGLVTERLVATPGSGACVLLGMVCYETEMKIKVLGLERELIDKHTVISEEVALAMAENVRKMAGADWGIGTTGLAGPPTPEDPDNAGTIIVAVSSEKTSKVKTLKYPYFKREDVIYLGSQSALNLLRVTLLQESENGTPGSYPG